MRVSVRGQRWNWAVDLGFAAVAAGIVAGLAAPAVVGVAVVAVVAVAGAVAKTEVERLERHAVVAVAACPVELAEFADTIDFVHTSADLAQI